MTKKDIVESGIKLIAVFYGFRLVTVIVAIIFDAIFPQSRGHANLIVITTTFITFLIASAMVWKSEMIIGWLFKKEK